jgi:RNA polymerase sigma-70 factor, ECF subfamily
MFEPVDLDIYAEPRSFADFYATEYDSALALAFALVASRSDAEELVQDAFADAHRRWRHVSALDKPGAWVRRAVLNRSVSLKRRWLTRLRSPQPMVVDVELEPRDDELWTAVRRLPARQAQLVALVYVDGLSITDAAAVIGVSLSTAATHLTRAKERLQRDLADWKEPS